MLDIKYIRENKDAVKKNCELRNIRCDVDRLLELDEKVKQLLWKIEELRLEKNKINDEIQKASDTEKTLIISKGKKIKEELGKFEPEFEKVEKEWKKLIIQVPNMTHPDSPIGKDDSESREI